VQVLEILEQLLAQGDLLLDQENKRLPPTCPAARFLEALGEQLAAEPPLGTVIRWEDQAVSRQLPGLQQVTCVPHSAGSGLCAAVQPLRVLRPPTATARRCLAAACPCLPCPPQSP
jgi:hypothetical protein